MYSEWDAQAVGFTDQDVEDVAAIGITFPPPIHFAAKSPAPPPHAHNNSHAAQHVERHLPVPYGFGDESDIVPVIPPPPRKGNHTPLAAVSPPPLASGHTTPTPTPTPTPKPRTRIGSHPVRAPPHAAGVSRQTDPLVVGVSRQTTSSPTSSRDGSSPSPPVSSHQRPVAVVRHVQRAWDGGEGFGFTVGGHPVAVTAVLPRLEDGEDPPLRVGDVVLQVNGISCSEGSAPTIKQLIASAAGTTLHIEVLRAVSSQAATGTTLSTDDRSTLRYSPPTPQTTPKTTPQSTPLRPHSAPPARGDVTAHTAVAAGAGAKVLSSPMRPPAATPPRSSSGDAAAASPAISCPAEVDWDGAVVVAKGERRASAGRTRRGSHGSLGRGERGDVDSGRLGADGGTTQRSRSRGGKTPLRRQQGAGVRPRTASDGATRRGKAAAPVTTQATTATRAVPSVPRQRLGSLPAAGGSNLAPKRSASPVATVPTAGGGSGARVAATHEDDWEEDPFDEFGECGSDAYDSGGGPSISSSSEHSTNSLMELTKENLTALQESLGATEDARAPRAKTVGRLSGWLHLETVPGSWASRWCKLEAHELILFADSLETRTLGVVALLGASINAVNLSTGDSAADAASPDNVFAFEVVTSHGGSHAVRLCTRQWDERQTWMRALRRAAVRTEDLDPLERKLLENRIEKELFKQCGIQTGCLQYASVARQLSALKSSRPPANPSIE
eukprot:m.21777 g.21777  ORF g.21777 m.21777 type:complete len:725 (+) comp3927_c0_seq1:356-2530(+)